MISVWGQQIVPMITNSLSALDTSAFSIARRGDGFFASWYNCVWKLPEPVGF